MSRRIYICHTFYHVYVTALKELALRRRAQSEEAGAGDVILVLSRMSNRFGSMVTRAGSCPLFTRVYEFDEKSFEEYPELVELKRDRGSFLLNMLQRIRFTGRYGQLTAADVPLEVTCRDEIYVFCDSDPIGYYLNYRGLPYHAVEDGLNAIHFYDTARYDNRGHFRLKALLARTGLIFIQNGYSRYCLDMEVNDKALAMAPEGSSPNTPFLGRPRYVEVPRQGLVDGLTPGDKEVMLSLFIENMEELRKRLSVGRDSPRVLILSEPLCDLDTRQRIFRDLVDRYSTLDGRPAVVMIKQHPRDHLNYEELFPDVTILSGSFPMEMLNFIPDLIFDRVVSVYTVVDSLKFVKDKVFLGDDFMDGYENPALHRFNEAI